jgi:acyl carrier protein
MEPSPASDDVLSAIQGVMKELFDLEPGRVQPAARLKDDLGLDSVDALDLVARMEELTGQALDEVGLRKIRTVADVMAAVQAVMKGVGRVDRVPA